MLEKPRRLSSQRLELCGARGRGRTAGQGGAIARGGGHDGTGGGDQFFTAQRGAGRGILPARPESSNRCAPDEILQMFGRAGRRGLDETGFHDHHRQTNCVCSMPARPSFAQRRGGLDALAGLDGARRRQGRDPFLEAVRVQERLFTTKPISLGVEESFKHPDVPCGLKTDAERARHVRRRVRQMLNSGGEWEDFPQFGSSSSEDIRTDARARCGGEWPTKLKSIRRSAAVERVGKRALCVLENERGQDVRPGMTVADVLKGRIMLNKWVRRLINWNGRQIHSRCGTRKSRRWSGKLAQQKTPVMRFQDADQRVMAQVASPNSPCGCRWTATASRSGNQSSAKCCPPIAPGARSSLCAGSFPPAPAWRCSGGVSASWMPRAHRPCAGELSALLPKGSGWRFPPRWRMNRIRSRS